MGLPTTWTLGGSPTVETYHADQIGSIREITNSDGSVRTTYLTDEYGNRTSRRGTDDQPFQYTGEQVDPETGFLYLRARFYDPQIGRFLTRDCFRREIGSLTRATIPSISLTQMGLIRIRQVGCKRSRRRRGAVILNPTHYTSCAAGLCS
jgi:RHS repeat-associated protein